jgi:hypothetical protein
MPCTPRSTHNDDDDDDDNPFSGKVAVKIVSFVDLVRNL